MERRKNIITSGGGDGSQKIPIKEEEIENMLKKELDISVKIKNATIISKDRFNRPIVLAGVRNLKENIEIMKIY